MRIKEFVINKFDKLVNKERAPKVVRLLRVFASILYFALILLLALTIGTTEKGLEGMTHSFVESRTVDEKYYEHYLEYGFTNESCKKLLEGKEIKYLTADIMTERMRAVFRGTKSYKISLEEAKSRIRKALVGVIDEQGLELDDTSITTLVDYTADISGISTMFWYDTPSEYRTAIFDASKGNTEMSNSLLETLALLSSPFFILIIFVMFIIVMVILYFLDTREKKFSFLNVTLYPSLALLGFSIGEIFMPDAPAITDYVFRLIIISSIVGIVLGVGIFFLVKLLEGREKE